ncbi:MAG: pilus assembly protein TadG-related protein [Hyphomicrobiales bacterium]
MRRFWIDTRGQIAVIFGLALPALIATMGAAVDYTAWTAQSRKLQAIADISAMAAAKELYLANADIGQVISVATSVADAQLALDNGNTAPLTVSSQVINDGQSVEVTVSQSRQTYFSHLFASDFGPLTSTAVARLAGGGRLCVIGLDENASTTVSMRQDAQVTATQCSLYSNSTSLSGIDVSQSANIEAELICSAGGADGGAANYTPSPTTDCPQLDDPLSSRPAPVYGSCDHSDLEISDQTVTLQPGVYCGGLTIKATSDVTMAEGIYIIKDGPLTVTSNSIVYGEYVGIYFTGVNAVYNFESNSDIDFTAPRDGPMAGILFFEDRNAPLLREHVIKSKKADNLLGTIYLPRGVFVVETNNNVADQSAYTAVIANRIELAKKPNLYLNADYGSTDVPVPSGIGPVGGNIVLEK